MSLINNTTFKVARGLDTIRQLDTRTNKVHRTGGDRYPATQEVMALAVLSG